MKSPRKALKGFLLFRLLEYLIVISLIAIFVPYGYYVFLLIPIILIWLYIRFSDNGMYRGDEFVVLRYRKLARKTVIIQKECIQSMRRFKIFFKRENGISKYKVNIAGDIWVNHIRLGIWTKLY